MSGTNASAGHGLSWSLRGSGFLKEMFKHSTLFKGLPRLHSNCAWVWIQVALFFELLKFSTRAANLYASTARATSCAKFLSVSSDYLFIIRNTFRTSSHDSFSSQHSVIMKSAEIPTCPLDLINLDPTDARGACAFPCNKPTMFSKVVLLLITA